MGMKVSETGGKDFEPIEAGSYAAVCTQIIGVGLQETPWGLKDKIKMRFEVPSERVEWEIDGEVHEGPAVIWTTYTASLSERANLRHDLEAWRGRSFTPDELAGFDMDNVLGAPCMLSVVHKTNDKGKTFANIASISKLPKGMPKPEPEGEVIGFDPDNHTKAEFDALPEWLQKMVQDGLRNTKESETDGKQSSAPPDESFQDDDIPF